MTDKAMEYEKLIELSRAYIREQPIAMNNPGCVADYMRPLVINRPAESFYVMTTNKRLNLITWREVTRGLVDRSLVHAREVYRDAILDNASTVLLVHNHPGGDTTPSPEDVKTTRMLASAGDIVGIQVMDHIILGPTPDYFSFREAGLLNVPLNIQTGE